MNKIQFNEIVYLNRNWVFFYAVELGPLDRFEKCVQASAVVERVLGLHNRMARYVFDTRSFVAKQAVETLFDFFGTSFTVDAFERRYSGRRVDARRRLFVQYRTVCVFIRFAFIAPNAHLTFSTRTH